MLGCAAVPPARTPRSATAPTAGMCVVMPAGALLAEVESPAPFTQVTRLVYVTAGDALLLIAAQAYGKAPGMVSSCTASPTSPLKSLVAGTMPRLDVCAMLQVQVQGPDSASTTCPTCR